MLHKSKMGFSMLTMLKPILDSMVAEAGFEPTTFGL